MCTALVCLSVFCFFFFSSRRRHTRFDCDWSSDVCSSDLVLLAYDWPGNVRELENVLERAVVLTKAEDIDRPAMPEKLTEHRAEPLVAERPHANPTLDVIERAYITWVLQSEGGNKTRAAEVLGIDPSTLYRKLGRYEVGEQ